MPTLRIPLVGSYINRGVGISPTLSSKDQFFTNCYPEIAKNSLSGKSKAYLYKRPGYSASSAYSSVATGDYAICTWTGKTATATPPVVAGFTNSGGTSTSVWDIVNNTQIGSSIANTKDVTALNETVISGTANLVGYFRDSATSAYEQWYYPDGGAWTQTVDADFPSNVVGAPVCLDGYVFNMTADGKIFNSDLNSASAYSASSYITMSQYPDAGVTLGRMHDYIVGFGRGSIEFFKNAGNPGGSVLVRTDIAYTIGALLGTTTTPPSPTVLTAFGSLYWLATDANGAYIGVYRIGEGLKPEKISTPSIDRMFESAGLSWIAGPMILHGMKHVAFNNTNSSLLCYCIDTGQWWILTLGSGANTTVAACSTSNYTSVYGARTFWVDNGTAKGYQFDFTNQDISNNFTMTVETESMDAGSDRMKFWKKLRVVADTQSATSNLGVAWSDDDYGTYTSARNIDMSSRQTWITSLGASRRRSWKFTNTANTACRIHAIEIDYTLGSH